MSILSNLSGKNIAIVAPGGYAPDEPAFIRTLEALKEQGCRLHNYYEPSQKHLRFGGTDKSRVEQLHAAARNPDVQIILALRGGYGMTRLLPEIDFSLLAQSGKLLVGHSDFTALHMGLLALTDAVSFAGPMLCDDFTRADISDFTMRHFWDCISRPHHVVSVNVKGNPAVDLSGRLWGGNLAMLTHLVGTPYMPSIQGGILFVEDVNEHPYRVERMLMQLVHSGILHKQKALLLGEFSGYRLVDYDNGYDFDAMLSYIREKVGIPVLTGLPFGHVKDKVTLAVGCQARLITEPESLTLEMRTYPHLSV